MEIPEIGHDGLVQESDTIMGTVALKIGAVVGRYRQLEVARSTQGRPAQRTLSGDVDDIGPPELPQPDQGALGRHTHAQVRVPWNRQTPHQDLVKP